MSLNSSVIIILNIILCAIILFLSIMYTKRSGVKQSIFIGIAFGLFGLSHVIAYFYGSGSLTLLITIIRLSAYLLIIVVLAKLLKSTQQANTVLEEKSRFQLLFLTSPDAVLLSRLSDGVFVDFNESLNSLSGYSREELIGKTSQEIGLFKDPLARQNFLGLVLREGYCQNFEAEIYAKDRSVLTILISARVIEIQGVSHLLSVLKDISLRKEYERAMRESEEKFSKAFKNSPDVILITAIADGKIYEVNESITRISGYTRDEFIGHTTLELNFWKDTAKREAYINNIFAVGQVLNYETEFRKKDGGIITGLISGELIELSDAKYILSIIHDITFRKKAEETLKENEIRLRQLNRTKDILLSIIAHDLRGPFTGILGSAELLEESINSGDKEETLELLRLIGYQAGGALALLDNLLQWAKAQTGQISFSPAKLNLKHLVNDTVEIMQPAAKAKNIGLRFFMADSVEVTADCNMLQTVIRNLVSNGLKFTNSGGNVMISAIPTGSEIKITIADDGIGMDENTLKKLFKLESHLSTPGTANEKGSGLGLILCREFIERHGGKLTIESAPGKGSSFSFSLPSAKNRI